VIVRQVSRAEIVPRDLLVLESTRNSVRLSRMALPSPQELRRCLDRLQEHMRHFMLSDLTLHLCASKSFPVVTAPRSLDPVDLRTALWFHEREPLRRFVTLDGNQEQAAGELGLPT